MNGGRDASLESRPTSYFATDDPQLHIIASIKGADRKALAKRMAAEGRLKELPALIMDPALEDRVRNYTGSIHPSLMGGEYLPDLVQDEVEIARITIESTTQDVTCVYASRVEGKIACRVVDEYDGQTLSDDTTCLTVAPLTLRELIDFFLGGWDLIGVLDMNFADYGYPTNDIHGFFRGSSEFYPDFDLHVRQRVADWLHGRRTELGLDQIEEPEGDA
jgi:hypothetical protein